MSRIISLLVVLLIGAAAWSVHPVSAASATTQPTIQDLKLENIKLQGQLDVANDRNKSLQQQLDFTTDRLTTAQQRMEELAKRVITLEKQLLAVRTSVAPAPSPFSLTIPPQQTPNGRSFPYNGRTVYVEPIAHDDILSIVPSPTAGPKSGVYEMTQGTLIDNRAKP